MKFSFKNYPRSTGLARVAEGQPSIEIRIKGKQCGILAAPTWRDTEHVWTIRFMIMDSNQENKDWKWIQLKHKTKTSDEAKEWLNSNIDTIVEKYQLRFSEK